MIGLSCDQNLDCTQCPDGKNPVFEDGGVVCPCGIVDCKDELILSD